MKKLVFFLVAFSLVSCNDGDYDVPAFDFETTVYSCDDTLLYIMNSDETEAFILEFDTDDLATEEGTETFSISTTYTATYRLFDDSIGDSYFCQAIPSSTPNVIDEIEAESGTITVVTTADETDGEITGYTYDISISDLLLLDGTDRIFYESFDFGTYTVTL